MTGNGWRVGRCVLMPGSSPGSNCCFSEVRKWPQQSMDVMSRREPILKRVICHVGRVFQCTGV